jgi:hypothetical protein
LVEGKPVPPSQWLKNSDNEQTVDCVAWSPGEPKLIHNTIFTDEGRQRIAARTTLNRWKPGPAVEEDAPPADRWLYLVDKMFPNRAEREEFLNRLAFIIQKPGQIVPGMTALVGPQGIGKDMLLMPLNYALGCTMSGTSRLTTWLCATSSNGPNRMPIFVYVAVPQRARDSLKAGPLTQLSLVARILEKIGDRDVKVRRIPHVANPRSPARGRAASRVAGEPPRLPVESVTRRLFALARRDRAAAAKAAAAALARGGGRCSRQKVTSRNTNAVQVRNVRRSSPSIAASDYPETIDADDF